MLRVSRVTDPTGRYYLADLATELHAATGERDPPTSRGRWMGAGAEGLGLRGAVEEEALAAVLCGRDPRGQHPLRWRETASCAYDLTFAAPKSASVLFALGTRATAAAVRDAHEAAVEGAMDYVAAHAAAVRRTTTDRRELCGVDGLVAASFTHGVSRALDPHLHSHVVVANVAHGDDGRWRAVDGRGLYAHARAAGALYDAALRYGITARVGLGWIPATRRGPGSSPAQGFELEGMDPVLLGALSGRRSEILAHARTHSRRARSPGAGPASDIPSPRARTVAWAATREAKGVLPSSAELRSRWESVAEDAGWLPGLLRDEWDRRALEPHGEREHAVDEHSLAGAVYERSGRGVARREFVAAWAGALVGGATADDVGRCVDLVAEWGAGIGVAERCHPPAALVPPARLVRLLGPRPASPDGLVVWQSAASRVEQYRERWGVHDPQAALGPGTRASLAALSPRRLADRLATARVVADALARLGRRRERDLDHVRVIGRDRDPVRDRSGGGM